MTEIFMGEECKGEVMAREERPTDALVRGSSRVCRMTLILYLVILLIGILYHPEMGRRHTSLAAPTRAIVRRICPDLCLYDEQDICIGKAENMLDGQ